MRWYRDSWPVGVGAAVAVIGSAALAVSSVTPVATAQTTTRARAKAPAQSPAQPGSDVTHITIDGKRHGPVFDGVGAIAGGGGNPGYSSTTRPSSRTRSSTTSSALVTRSLSANKSSTRSRYSQSGGIGLTERSLAAKKPGRSKSTEPIWAAVAPTDKPSSSWSGSVRSRSSRTSRPAYRARSARRSPARRQCLDVS
jgi:hypothetical protein